MLDAERLPARPRAVGRRGAARAAAARLRGDRCSTSGCRGSSGIELAQLIKQRKRTQHVPILFLTAHLVDDEDVLRGYGVGAVDYLSKPVNADILRSKVAVFVELFRKTRALADARTTRFRARSRERQKAQEALQQANQELELRVARANRRTRRLRIGACARTRSGCAWRWRSRRSPPGSGISLPAR